MKCNRVKRAQNTKREGGENVKLKEGDVSRAILALS